MSFGDPNVAGEDGQPVWANNLGTPYWWLARQNVIGNSFDAQRDSMLLASLGLEKSELNKQILEAEKTSNALINIVKDIQDKKHVTDINLNNGLSQQTQLNNEIGQLNNIMAGANASANVNAQSGNVVVSQQDLNIANKSQQSKKQLMDKLRKVMDDIGKLQTVSNGLGKSLDQAQNNVGQANNVLSQLQNQIAILNSRINNTKGICDSKTGICKDGSGNIVTGGVFPNPIVSQTATRDNVLAAIGGPLFGKGLPDDTNPDSIRQIQELNEKVHRATSTAKTQLLNCEQTAENVKQIAEKNLNLARAEYEKKVKSGTNREARAEAEKKFTNDFQRYMHDYGVAMDVCLKAYDQAAWDISNLGGGGSCIWKPSPAMPLGPGSGGPVPQSEFYDYEGSCPFNQIQQRRDAWRRCRSDPTTGAVLPPLKCKYDVWKNDPLCAPGACNTNITPDWDTQAGIASGAILGGFQGFRHGRETFAGGRYGLVEKEKLSRMPFLL